MITRLRQWFSELILSRTAVNEGIERFMKPQDERLKALGVMPFERFMLGEIAIKQSDFIARFPGMNLRDMTDAIERGETTASEIIRDYHDKKGFE